MGPAAGMQGPGHSCLVLRKGQLSLFAPLLAKTWVCKSSGGAAWVWVPAVGGATQQPWEYSRPREHVQARVPRPPGMPGTISHLTASVRDSGQFLGLSLWASPCAKQVACATSLSLHSHPRRCRLFLAPLREIGEMEAERGSVTCPSPWRQGCWSLARAWSLSVHCVPSLGCPPGTVGVTLDAHDPRHFPRQLPTRSPS